MDLPKLPENKDLTYVGFSTYRDKNQLFGIKRKDRRQHVYILGKSGTGKSVLMFNMIIQNILNGEGVCVVDPHGELVEGVLQAIPEHRLKDVVYFNPADTEHHIGFNVLELVDEKYKHLVASGLMGIFTKIWANAWSARMEYILNNTILALLDTPGSTLLGIPRMLVDKDYRQKIINNLKDPVIKAFWVHEYEAWQDKFRNEAIAPIQNKVGQFLSTSVIRNIVGQAKSTINIFDMMNEGKIFLVNVSKGRIGEDNSKLLGGMIITKIQLAAMERVRIPEDDRKDFYLYVDEFQNFVTDSFASILSEARKYRLNLTVAHQYTAQLVTKESSAMRDSIFGNVGTMIIFRVGADDADFLEKEFAPEFTPEDIVNLPNYKIYLKLMIDGVTSRPFSAKTIAPLVRGGNKAIEDEVIRSSRELYCRSKEDIEKEINNWSGMSLGDSNDSPGGGSSMGGSGMKFPAECSSCQKETFVPFKPEPGRPVYCKDCIAKIKAGEIKPVKVSVEQVKKDEFKFFKPLADLGIEFATDPVKKPPEKNNAFPVNKNITAQKSPTPPTPPVRPANNALKDLLTKTLSQNDSNKTLEIKKVVPIPVEEKKIEPKPISLNDLKAKQPISVPMFKDRSASSNDMNNLKSFISQAVDSVVVQKDIPKPAQTVVSPKIEPPKYVPPQVTPQPPPIFNVLKIEEPKIEPTITKTEESVNSAQPQNKPNNKTEDNPPAGNNVREVPEEVLRKVLEN